MSSLLIARADHRTMPFVRVLHSTIQDTRLSLTARGLLALMLSYEDGHVMDAAALKAEGLGDDAGRAAVKELIRNGYAERVRIQVEKGYWGWALRVTEISHTSENKANNSVSDLPKNPISEKSDSRNFPPSENPTIGQTADRAHDAPAREEILSTIVDSTDIPEENRTSALVTPDSDKSTEDNANALSRGKKRRATVPREPKPPKPDIPARAYQEAFIAGFGYTGSAYKNAPFLRHIKRAYTLMHGLGMTPADVPDLLDHCKAQRHDRKLIAHFIHDEVLPFEAQVSAKRAQLALDYTIPPCDEYPSGLPIGVSPDDPMAEIYRAKPTDPTADDIDFRAFIAGKEALRDRAAIVLGLNRPRA